MFNASHLFSLIITPPKVFKVKVAKKINMIINRLNKTKEEREVDLAAEREARDASMRQEKKHIAAEQVITCCL